MLSCCPVPCSCWPLSLLSLLGSSVPSRGIYCTAILCRDPSVVGASGDVPVTAWSQLPRIALCTLPSASLCADKDSWLQSSGSSCACCHGHESLWRLFMGEDMAGSTPKCGLQRLTLTTPHLTLPSFSPQVGYLTDLLDALWQWIQQSLRRWSLWETVL